MAQSLIVAGVREKYQALSPILHEKARRCWAACEALSLGYGGISLVATATGLSRPTIRRGISEIQAGDLAREDADRADLRIRRAGGGRHALQAGGDEVPFAVLDLAEWQVVLQRVGKLQIAECADGTFTDITASSGLGAYLGKGMGVAVADYDGDGLMDIFVSNDSVPNFLFHNLGHGKFEEVSMLAGVALNDNGRPVASMGADFRDVDNDGRPDLLFTAMFNDTFPFFRNTGKSPAFEDDTASSGLALLTRRLTGWGVGFYQGGEVLLQRRPKQGVGPLDFYEVLRDVRTDVLVAHLRKASVGDAKNSPGTRKPTICARPSGEERTSFTTPLVTLKSSVPGSPSQTIVCRLVKRARLLESARVSSAALGKAPQKLVRRMAQREHSAICAPFCGPAVWAVIETGI